MDELFKIYHDDLEGVFGGLTSVRYLWLINEFELYKHRIYEVYLLVNESLRAFYE